MAAPIDAGSIYSDVRIRLDKLNGDIKSVQTSLDKITKASTDTAKKSQKGLGKFFSFIKTSGVGAFLALGAVIAGTVKFLKDSEAAASDAQEVYSKFDVVFESIQESANKTADEIAESFGIAESTSRELLSATGDILVGFGFTEEAALSLAKQTTELSADLASFTNFEGGAARASAALTKALVGESESVKALGIVIRQDTKEYKERIKSIMETNNVTQIQAKALAALQIATEQSGKAIGDVALTWDSAANVEKRLTEQTKALEEAVGVGLLPTVTAIRKKLGEWAEAITKVLVESNKLRDAERAAAEGNETRAQAILLLERQIENEKKSLELTINNGRVTQTTIDLKQKLYDAAVRNLQGQITIQKRLQQTEKELEDARIAGNKVDEAIALRKEAVDKAQLEALTELTKRQFDALTPQQQRLQLIDEEIDSLAILRNDAEALGVESQAIQNLINDLYRERAEIQAEELENDKVVLDFKKGIVDEWREKELERIFTIDEAEKQAAADRKQELEDRIALTFTYAGLVISILNSLRDLQSNNNQAELDELQMSLDAKLANAEAEGASDEELTALKEANAEEFAKKKKEFAIEEAKRNKALAILNIAINTASAIVAALVSIPPNVPLSIAVGATGLIQAAIVAAQPIPSFATGGIVLPSSGGSLINVAENGSPELMLNSGASGQALLQEFANQIVDKMGGGNQVFYLTLPNGKVLAEAVAPSFNNGIVPLRLT